MPIPRDRFVRALWTLGFEFVTNTGVAQVFWRAPDSKSVIEVPKAEQLDEEWARAELRRCGIAEFDIDTALRS